MSASEATASRSGVFHGAVEQLPCGWRQNARPPTFASLELEEDPWFASL